MSSAPITTSDDRVVPHPLRSLAFRINVWYVVALLGSLALLAAFAVPVVRAAFERERTVVLEQRIERHVALLTAGLPAYRDAVERSLPLDEAPDSVRVRDEQGRILYERGDVSRARVVAQRVIGRLRVELGAPAMQWEVVLDRLRPGVIALACGALLISVIGGYLTMRRSMRPVRELAMAAREVIRSGDFSRRVAERGSGDELDNLSVLFNRMIERNQRLVAAMRNALDNVAHDLRTPLTRMRGTAELALRTDDPGAARDALADCIEDSDRVLVMLRAVMDISEAETGIMRLERTRVSLARLAGEVADVYEHVAEEAGVQLVVSPIEDVTLAVDPVRVRQAIANLVDNAIKYTPAGGRITIETGRFELGDGVRVRDTGIGVPPEAVPRIWDRLYRADSSRSTRGLGLGLSLVKAIVEAHGGRVGVVSEEGRGSTFTIAFPRAL